jgi:hypothetical protein
VLRSCEAVGVPPLVLALIDAVLALAFHHDQRATSVSVRAELRGPEQDEPAPGGLEVRVSVTPVPHSEAREVSEDTVRFHVDLRLERLLASDLALAELPLDRTGFALLLGALEGWCYERIPLERVP